MLTTSLGPQVCFFFLSFHFHFTNDHFGYCFNYSQPRGQCNDDDEDDGLCTRPHAYGLLLVGWITDDRTTRTTQQGQNGMTWRETRKTRTMRTMMMRGQQWGGDNRRGQQQQGMTSTHHHHCKPLLMRWIPDAQP